MTKTSSKKPASTRIVIAVIRLAAIALIAVGLFWKSWDGAALEEVPVDRLRSAAARIEERFGLEIGIDSPEKFQQAIGVPLPADVVTVHQANPHQLMPALMQLESAMSVYPKALLTKFLSGVYLGHDIQLDGRFKVGATYAEGAIYLAVDFIRTPQDAREIALGFHHELSSFLYLYVASGTNPANHWDANNPSGFAYPISREERLAAATRAAPSWQAESWYEQGFVSDYGQSSRENDVNTYAELLMGDPAKLVELAARWPRIDGKARILARFYASIDDGLAAHLRSTPARVFLDE